MRYSNLILRKMGFTLVELLVVIAIIGLLITLVFPAVNRARDQARISVSTSNLRTIGQLNYQYASNHNGLIPVSNWDLSSNWIRVLYEMAYPAPWPGFVPNDTGKNLRGTIFYSPALKRSEPTPHRSYGWNTHLVSARSCRRVAFSSIRDPSLTMLCADSRNFSGIWQSNPSDDLFTYRNAGKANILFADGHVEARASEQIPRGSLDEGFGDFWFRYQ